MSLIGTTIKKINYLNNRDLLAEIHKSKCSYSSFVKPEYAQHDIIVPSLEHITDEIINEAKKNKVKRLAFERFTVAKNNGDKKIKLIDCQIDINTIHETDIVIRVMTFDHIPLAPGRKKTIKRIADSYVKINFPPFQHWKFSENNELICVGKSHWKGPVDTGCFAQVHGRITENLGRMFIKLTERYAQKSNWRGYTYNEEMRGQAIVQLSQIGLQFDELKSENPFAYYTAAITNSFTRVLNVEKQSQDIRDDLLENAGLTPSSTRQNSQAYAGEIARQAELYKKLRMPKSEEVDENFNAESNEIFEEIDNDEVTQDVNDDSVDLQSTP